MMYDQAYYRGVWGRILKKYGPNHPIEDLGDLSRADILRQALLAEHRRQASVAAIHDYGAGNWLYLDTILGIFPSASGVQVHGFDYSEEALAYGVERVRLNGIPSQEVYPHGGDILAHLFAQPSSSVDIVVSLETLEHLERDVETVREFFRVIVPGGCMILSVPNIRPFPMSRNFFSYVFFRKKFTEKDVRVGHLRRYSIPDLRALAESAGFSVEETWPYGMLCSDYLKPIAAFGGLWARAAFAVVRMENRMGRRWGVGASEGFFLLCRKPKTASSC